MDERKASEADVERVVRSFIWPRDEMSIRHETRLWGSADFLYAIGRVHVDLQAIAKRDEMLSIYKRLRDECVEREARAESESANAKRHAEAERANPERHAEIARRLDKLKEPHWTVLPNFWLTLIAAVAGVVAAALAWVGLKK
jgi:hypothetical protein